jgi:Fe-S cluster biogenesis protein NfuA
VLCIGPLPNSEGDFCLTARECSMLSHAIDDPGFGLHLGAAALAENGETGHANFVAARRRLKTFHIDEPGRVRIGSTGTVDHADMRRHLAAINYRGWLSIVQRFVPDTIAIDELSDSVRYVADTYFKESSRMDPSSPDTARLRVITETIAAVRPNVQADGGDLELIAVRGDRIEVRLSGKCRTCAMAGQTLGGLRRKLISALGEPVMVIPEQS